MTTRSVEILEGNETIRRIMSESLQRLGVDVVASDSGEAPEQLCDVLVADVDSGLATEQRAATYLDDDRVVVFCGLRDSRDQYSDERWVGRPFTPNAFVAECADALGIDHTVEATPEPAFDLNATAALVAPPKLKSKGDEPITRELEYDEAQELERRLGLDPGVLRNSPEETVSDEESFEVLDIDDSAILAVDHLKFALGGKLKGSVAARRVDADELASKREEEISVRGTRNRTFNQTMPDTPHALSDSDSDAADDARDRRVTTSGTPLPQPQSPADSSLDELPRAATGGDLGLQIRGVARMLAESWQRIALTSRTEDRADRIERVLTAAVGKGLRGAAEEVQRIPPASGFAGSLSSLTFVELVRTVRDRRLRGRLELAVGDEAFVVHMDGLYLEEIDTLSGNVDGMLLDILHQGGAIDDRAYNELIDAWEAGKFTGPLELELARKKVVADATLQSARVVRAREVFRRLCASRGGQFAFLEIRSGDGQPWPVDPLRVNVDQLILELLRESSIDTGDSQATASTRLQLDPNRAAALEQSRLTEEERNVMNFFREGDTLEAARERLVKQAGPEDVDRIVDRLKKVELLKRTDPTIAVPSKFDAPTPASMPTPTAPRTAGTAVSAMDEVLDEDRRLSAQLPAAKRPEPDDDEEDEDEHAQTTNLKPKWDIIPDTGELDDLIEEGIAAYESEASDSPGDDD